MRREFWSLTLFAAAAFVSSCNRAPADMSDDEAGPDLAASFSGSVGGRTWVDANGDGLYSVEEHSLANVWVALLTLDGETVERITTDSDGTYRFDEVEAGQSYRINFDLPDGYQFTTRDAGDDAIDSDAVPEGLDQGITDAFEISILDDTWYAGYIEIPGSAVFDIEVELPECHDMNAADPVPCESAIIRYEAARDLGSSFTTFTADFFNSFDATVRDLCVLFDTNPDSGPTIAGLDGSDEGLCWNGYDQILVWVEIGPNGEWIPINEPTESQASMDANGSAESGGARIVFRLENSYLGLTQGRTKMYIFDGISTYDATDWVEFLFPDEGN